MVYFKASFYYVRYKVLGRIIRQTYRHFHWKVWLISVFFIFLYFVHQLLSVLFRAIDEVFYRGYKKPPLQQPVFIISSPRSGTTFLHRLMALDNERFVYTKFSHTFFMSASFVRFYQIFQWLDKKILRGFIQNTLNRLDAKFWGGWDNIHTMGFNKAEEDELVFAQMMMSPGVLIPFPYMHEVNDIKFLDNEPPDVRRKVMDFYESSIKRFVFRAGKNKTYLAKNVMSTGRFKTLMERFPDARIVYIIRHPYEAIPSMASMMTAMTRPITDNGTISPSTKAWVELSIDYYKYSQQMKEVIPEGQFIAVKYDDLLANPQQTVLDIYRHFKWQPTDKFTERLSHEKVRNGNYKSNHTYSLEQFGYTKEEIHQRVSDMMEEFKFEKGF